MLTRKNWLRPRAAFCFVLVAAALMTAASSAVMAQSVSSSTVHGVVTDESAGALPGVTVTLTSPALQVASQTITTEADGTYRFGDLPAGTYKLTFELAGFKTFVRDDLRLPIGFIARADVTMAVGGIEESVTVSGQSPVVNMTSTTTSVNLTRDALETVPTGRGYQQLFAMAPGVTTAGAPDVGDSNMGSRASIQNYGVAANAKIQVEGINISAGDSSGVYFTTFSFDEIQIKTSGNDAEVSVPGISMVSVLKSGSNQFHGSYSVSGQRPELQSSNINDLLRAQGLSNTAPLRYYYDVAGDLGGRIVKDKLWFYVAANRQKRVSGILGFASGPGADGRYLTSDDPLADYENSLSTAATKVSYQLSPSNRLIGVWQPALKYQPQRDATRFLPLEATTDYKNPSSMYKVELQSTIANRIVANVVTGYGGYLADYSAARSKFGNAVPGNPSRFDRELGLHTGSSDHSSIQHNDRWQTDAGVSFFPEKSFGGHHELKVGTSLYWERAGSGKSVNPAGDYTLVFDKANGLSGQPTEIDIYNAPVQPINRATHYAGYVKDTWHITQNFTANLGVRWEQQHAYFPAQSKAASPGFPSLFPAANLAALDVLTWYSTVPRLGLAWNVGSKTVIKATFGLYNAGLDNSFASPYNSNAPVTAAFRWSDQDGNGDYTPGEVDLDLNHGDFLSITGSSNNVLNEDLRQPMTTEVTAGVERELVQNVGFRALYVYKEITDQFDSTNILRPRSAYNIPLTRRDPGSDGALNTSDDGGMVTIFDYDPAYRGAAFVSNQLQNSSRDDHYQSLEFTLTKRSSGRWFGMASFWAIKNHRWLTLIPDNPNNDYFPLDETWNWAGNISGSYRFPWDVQVGAFLQTKIGVQGARTNVFRAADPDGGPSLKQLSTVTVNLEPFGSQTGPSINVLDLRASKQVSLGGSRRLELDFDLFNLLNSSAPTTITYASGPTFGYYGSTSATASASGGGILPSRVARFGAKYSF